MDGQMQDGPSYLPDEFFRFTNDTGVLHDHDHNVSPNTLLDVQSSEEDERPIFPYNLRLASSCLEAGIGIEVWALEKAWPGICNELWWFDFIHPGILHPATIAPINAMLLDQGAGNRRFRFDCPVFVAESRHGWPRTCNNIKSTNMAELRRHLTARAGRGYAPQLAFLELCTTCNEDFIDKHVFETRHGYQGELCNTRRPQRRGANAKVQWELLYRQVEAALAVQRLSTHQDQVNADPAPSQSDLNLAPPDLPRQLTPQPADNPRDQAMPYLTPYQLIYDSDPDEGEMVTSPHHTSMACSSGLEQSYPSHTSAYTPEWQSTSSFDAHRPLPAQNTNEEASRTLHSAIPSLGQPVMCQLDTSMSHYVSHTGGGTGYCLTTLSSGSDWDDRMEADGTDDTADCETPISDCGQDIHHRRWRHSDQASHNAYPLLPALHIHNETIAGSGSYPPSPFIVMSQDVSPIQINLERTATPPLERTPYTYPEQLDCAYLMPPEPRSSTPDTEANTTETDLSPEQHCDVEGCDAVFSGLHRKGNLARHKRLKHKGSPVYVCQDDSCDRVFKRQDARLKHYRRWHPQLAAQYHARPQARHANREQYPDFISSGSG